MKRTITHAGATLGEVTLNAPMLRYEGNPVLTAADVNAVWTDPGHQVVTVHNAGAARVGNQVVMLFRSHLRCGMSVLGAARSTDGVTGWSIDPAPAMVPATDRDDVGPEVDVPALVEMESGGVEDARLNPVEGTIAITYSAYQAEVANRVRVGLATSTDMRSIRRHGPMLQADMRNVVLFPEKVGGRYLGLFRPNDHIAGDTGGAYTQIRVGTAADFRTGPWHIDDTPIMQTGRGPNAFSDKIGPGAPPVRTEYGWLNLFHGVRGTMAGNPYVLGIALHDLDDPRKVRVSAIPVLFPTAADCRTPEDAYVHVPQVVFSCAMLDLDGTLVVYYAGNDTVMNVAFTHADVLAELCIRYGADPLTGTALYPL
jgi:predicted GH43/DUF377 family glycosyl hydrolase